MLYLCKPTWAYTGKTLIPPVPSASHSQVYAPTASYTGRGGSFSLLPHLKAELPSPLEWITVSLRTLVLGEFSSTSGSKPDEQGFYERTFWFGQWEIFQNQKLQRQLVLTCFLKGPWFTLISPKGIGKVTGKDIVCSFRVANRLVDLVWLVKLK